MYYAKIVNGIATEYPYLEENLLEVYGSIDIEVFQPFTPVEMPFIKLEPFEYLLDTPRQTETGWTVDWVVTPMNDLQKEEVITRKRAEVNELVQKIITDTLAELELDPTNTFLLAYLDVINTFTFTDPFSPKIPQPPRRDSLGNWYSTSTTGTAPNVIG